jgi:hypothetical protein
MSAAGGIRCGVGAFAISDCAHDPHVQTVIGEVGRLGVRRSHTAIRRLAAKGERTYLGDFGRDLSNVHAARTFFTNLTSISSRSTSFR